MESGHPLPGSSASQCVALLDDGTAVIELQLGQFVETQENFAEPRKVGKGMYVAVLGIMSGGVIEVSSVKDLSSQPDRFAMWMCELIDRSHVPIFKPEQPE